MTLVLVQPSKSSLKRANSCDLLRAGLTKDMQTNAIPTSAPGDRAPTSEEPALIKMTNQQATAPPFPRQTKLPARFTSYQPDYAAKVT